VAIVLPLLPTFEGALQGAATSALSGALYWQLRAIASLRERLATLVHDPEEYLMFFGALCWKWCTGSDLTDLTDMTDHGAIPYLNIGIAPFV
jgi:hypothetical protein